MQFVIPGLQILIAFQCVFFLVYLVLDRKLTYVANQILGALLLTMGTHMLLNLINQHISVGLLPNISIGLGLLYGPLIYLYVKALTTGSFRLARGTFFHFVPGLIVSTSVVWLFLPVVIYAGAIFVSLFVYAVASYRILARYQRVLQATRSEDDRITLRWLSSLLLFQIFLLVANVASVTFDVSGQAIASYWAEVSLFVFLAALVSMIILKGLQLPVLFDGISPEDVLVAAAMRKDGNAGTRVQSGSKDQEHLLERLRVHMKEHEPFLDPSLSLLGLAKQMGETPRTLSLLINTALDQNFSRFVNTYRIEAAKRLLRDEASRDLSVIQIMYEAGFNTKSNFNKSFKEATGLTPRQFRDANPNIPGPESPES